MTWVDADEPPGPTVQECSPVEFKYVITNTGNVTLIDITLTDNVAGPIALSQTALAPLESTTAYRSSKAILGQYTNIGTATGTPPSGPNARVTNAANYFGLQPAGTLSQAILCDSIDTGSFRGYGGKGPGVVTAMPGVLVISPGDAAWSNYVAAAQAGVPYTVKNVTLQKVTPEVIQCSDVFIPGTILQHGTANIRLWWPLMYELPGTTWTLSILYGTGSLFDDDGPGPNPPAYVHSAVWEWQVRADVQDMKTLVDLFHELPYGLDEVPLISDEVLYETLQEQLTSIQDLIDAGDTPNAGLALGDFELMVADACIGVSPAHPNPTGPGTGIANSEQNPACCKLLVDAEFVGKQIGIFIQKK